MQKNIRIIALLNVLHSSLFGLALIHSYVHNREEFLLLQTVFCSVALVCEWPTGWMADLYGRRLCAALSSVALFIAWVSYCAADSLGEYLIAEVFFGISLSLRSGTFEALCFESLLDLQRARDTRVVGRKMFMAANVAGGIASLIGAAVVVTLGTRAVFMLSLPLLLAGVFVSRKLREPQADRARPHCIKSALRLCMETLKNHPVLRPVLFLYAAIASLTLLLAWSSAPFHADAELPPWAPCVIHAVLMLVNAGLAFAMLYLERWVDPRILILGFVAVVIGTTFVAGSASTSVAMIALLAGRGTFGALTPLTTDILHRCVASSVRATFFSVRSFLTRLAFITGVPAVEGSILLWGPSQTFIVIGIIGIAVILLLMAVFRKEWRHLNAVAHPEINAGRRPVCRDTVPQICVTAQG